MIVCLAEDQSKMLLDVGKRSGKCNAPRSARDRGVQIARIAPGVWKQHVGVRDVRDTPKDA